MADPAITQLANGSSSVATTTVSFTAQTAGSLLILAYAGDDYRTTSGAGRPESTGWTFAAGTGSGSGAFHGSGVWYKLSAGSETSVQYTIGSASRSAYKLIVADNIDQTTPLDIAASAQFANVSSASYTTPTSGTTTAGRRLGVAYIGASVGGSLLTAPGSWLNSYVSQGAGLSASAPGEVAALATLAFDGGGTTSSGATFSGTTPESKSGIIAVFRVAGAGGTQYPVSGTTAATAGTSATVAARLAVSGTSPATAASSATVAARLAVSGVAAATAASSLTLGAMLLAVQGTSVATTTAALTAIGLLGVTGTTDATTTTALTAAARRPVSGQTDATAATALTTVLTRPITGATAAVAGTSLTVGARLAVAGTTAASSAASLTVGLAQPVSGTTAAVTATSLTAELLPGGSFAVSGTSVAVAGTSLAVGFRGAASGQTDAVSGTSLDATARRPVSGTTTATTTAALTVGVLRPVAGQTDATSDSALTANVARPVTGATAAVTTVSLTVGVITGDALAVSGTTAAVTGVALTVQVRAAVTGLADATSGATLTVIAVIPVSGTVPVVTGVSLTVRAPSDEPARDITFTGTLGTHPWTAQAGTHSWTGQLGVPMQISTLSLEYVPAKLTSVAANGSPAVVFDAQPVYLGLVPTGTAAQLSDFYPAEWVGLAGSRRWCRMLIGPSGGVATFTAGIYDLYARVTDSSETVVQQISGQVTFV